MKIFARITILAKSRSNEAIADSFPVALCLNLIWISEGVVPESFGSLVLKTLEMALSSRRCVLELLVAVVTVIFSQWHILLIRTRLCLFVFTENT